MGGVTSEVIGRYVIYGKIASGGMASVHFGRLVGEEGFSRTVAIKRLHPHLAADPGFRTTMIDEARLAARIHHPNVVPTLDVVSVGRELLIVMEYLRGESLARLCKSGRATGSGVALPIASAVVIAVLHGLHAAHEATSDQGVPLGIVHRDVSPQNILVGVDGLSRVIDFGIAKAAGRLQTSDAGTIKGKIAYMAPEQLGSRPVTRTADVYAMGVVLWELLTGVRLFQGTSDMQLIAKVLAGPEGPPSRHVPGLPAGLDELVMRALASDPLHRFPTALEMAETLLRIAPPAFPTDVGSWCSEVAAESLQKRATMLAEIESRSSIQAPPRAPLDEAVTLPNDDPRLDAPLATLGTHSASLSLETPSPRPSVAPPLPVWRVASLVAGSVLVVGLATLWFLARVPTAPPPLDHAPHASQVSLPRLSAEPDPAPPRPPVVTSEPVPTASAAPPEPPPSELPVARPRPPSPAAKPKPSCTPPYVLDSVGHRQYKPECL